MINLVYFVNNLQNIILIIIYKMSPDKNNMRLPPEVNRILFVRNLPFKITAEELYDIFGKYGGIKQIRRGNTGKTKGTAFVVYEDIYDAKNAVDHPDGHAGGASGASIETRNRPSQTPEDSPRVLETVVHLLQLVHDLVFKNSTHYIVINN